MESRENPAYGRKVFFLNPPFNIRKLIISKLQELEYQIYVIDDYKNAKNVLRHYPDSICFINIDNHDGNELTVNQWFNFIQSFADDPVLKTIYTGILAGRTSQSEKNFFLLNANIPAGFISINETVEELVQILTGILDINGAKGRRQYVRAKCRKNGQAVVKITLNNACYMLQIIDISSVGLACELPPANQNAFPANTLLRDINIRLDDKFITCSAAVLSAKQFGDKLSLILLFLKGTSYSVKDAVRTYVFDQLHSEMLNAIVGDMPDTTVYSDKISLKDKDAFLMEADDSGTNSVSNSPDTEITGQAQTLTTLF